MTIAQALPAPGWRRILPLLLLLLFLLLAIALILVVELRMFAWDAATFVHQGFLAVYVDAEGFISGCL